MVIMQLDEYQIVALVFDMPAPNLSQVISPETCNKNVYF